MDKKEKEESSSYSESPVHQLILLNDLPRLRSLLSSSLPKLLPPSQIHTPSESLHQLALSSQVSAVLDNRNGVPNRETPLHLAVRLNSPLPVLRLLLLSGADPSLQNASGWTPLQVSLCLRRPKKLSLLLLRHHRLSAYAKFRRRLPLLLQRLALVPDFYMELSFRFESSLIPFLSAVAPSDVYRCWKRGVDLRVDTTLAGFDGLRVRRAEQSFIFSGAAKKLVVLDRGRKKAKDAFEGLDGTAEDGEEDCEVEDGEEEEDGMVEDASAYRPGLDITRAELVKLRNWRGKERVEAVGEWKAKVYEVKDVVFSFKTMKAAREEEERLMELELDEDAEDGYIVAEIPAMPPPMPARRSCYERGRFGGVDKAPSIVEVGKGRRSLDVLPEEGMRWEKAAAAAAEVGGKGKEKELVKSLRPVVWLTEDFPLKTEELIPMLDILANKVKAVRRLRELLTTKFPPATFPVKVSIPIVPTVRVIVTFTKFVNLQPSEEFFTPLSSPRHLAVPEDDEHRSGAYKSSWLRWSNKSAPKPSVTRSNSISPSQVVNHVDPFSIPSDYTWVSMKDKSKRAKKARSRKGKLKEAG
ncbi:ankyrin repeat domain-containing protein 13C-like [Iris pallida]|uniref:Ankyrin repeat domain-containing protein 13C-like n=1 Tax=Iris pallida TaxID=29817 RepID=A0AAX6G654_IRIPA|nr:ankyrin repeat domain-containing protein 13C-like [Iris pallida]